MFRDLEPFAGSGIPAEFRLARNDLKRAKAGEFHRLSRAKLGNHFTDDNVVDSFRIDERQV